MVATERGVSPVTDQVIEDIVIAAPDLHLLAHPVSVDDGRIGVESKDDPVSRTGLTADHPFNSLSRGRIFDSITSGVRGPTLL
jgi:hypothetical protein